MLPIENIAASIFASRSSFGRLFLQVQVDHVADPALRTAFEAVGLSGVDREAYKSALEYAQANGWLEPLVHALVEENLEDGEIAGSLVESASASGERRAKLQAMTNLARGFDNPALIYRGIASGMRWTVKVIVNGEVKGTGILIGPHLVLTAWHVVSALFSHGVSGGYEPVATAGSKLRVEFDDFLALVSSGAFAPRSTLTVPAHKEWCVIFSHCHAAELNDTLPDDLNELDGLWDYAVIRLAECPGIERRWASLDARAVVPRANSRIIVFQHPATQPLKTDQADIVVAEAATAAAIPRLRFLHAANATGGSSGGPCFDKTFMLFGLHQGVWTQSTANRTINRGVPIQRVIEDYKEKIKDLPVPDPSDSPIWRVADLSAPVIGCDVFQTMVWRSAIAGMPRVISIQGEAFTGKTFRLAVLSAMLSDGSHLKIELDATTISKLNAVELAQEICKAAGVADHPIFAPVTEFASTPAAWLRGEVLPKLMAALDAARAGRLVWLTIAELNKTDIQGENASALLLSIYGQTRSSEWLRIVLDGMKGDLPAAIHPLSDRDDVMPLDVDDIKVYVRRAIVGMELQVPNEFLVSVLAEMTMTDYRKWRIGDPSSALSLLAERVSFIVRIYLKDAAAGGYS
ncbi:trypsin-like serine peptidase [Noviherbaspirillum saxi]|uniref:Trypsin-like peptidase domain-containing protein n=1 Tax=Noviherbaspirillum saxi TaxID=2320863 RepID=A0A3A3FKE9_9BURK|nr:trypsin-like peptidase domain-containing protein [Noviherbaspirillum saxi]RJF95777.1 hypothetical protein D3871_20585 [Noviherbaspirillum saxi]